VFTQKQTTIHALRRSPARALQEIKMPTGAKEAELQGASSVIRGNVVLEGAQNAVAKAVSHET
jgi:hypothetical protein